MVDFERLLAKTRVAVTDHVADAEVRAYLERLYPICRSILGEGFRESLDILRELIPLEVVDIPSGTDVLDWTVPDEWTIEDAFILTPAGEKVAHFKDHNLHVVNYASPVDEEMELDALKEHIYTLPDRPDTIPYVCSYYTRKWGFCMTQNQLDSLEDGRYRAVVKSKIEPGILRYGHLVLPGETDQEILLSTYLCHPQMANHELSGPLLVAMLYRLLESTGPHRYTYRFVVCPENIGAAAFLADHGMALKEKIVAGYVVNCVAHGDHFTFKRSRRGDTIADRAALHVLRHRAEDLEEADFFPDGSDERQYCSPGFNMPVGLIMRTMFGRFPEYHTSDDDLDFFDMGAFLASVEAYWHTLLTIEANHVPMGRVQYGSPQLGKSPVPLYPASMNFRVTPKSERTKVILEILNRADGTEDLLAIADRRGFSVLEFADVVRDLRRAEYLSEA